jgi:hypothetical protein
MRKPERDGRHSSSHVREASLKEARDASIMAQRLKEEEIKEERSRERLRHGELHRSRHHHHHDGHAKHGSHGDQKIKSHEKRHSKDSICIHIRVHVDMPRIPENLFEGHRPPSNREIARMASMLPPKRYLRNEFVYFEREICEFLKKMDRKLYDRMMVDVRLRRHVLSCFSKLLLKLLLRLFFSLNSIASLPPAADDRGFLFPADFDADRPSND